MNKRELITLPVDQIVVTTGRELKAEMVKDIASSIEVAGLLNPISVVANDDGSYRLISGRHRLEAMRSLRQTHIEAQSYRGLSDDDVRRAEIIENLCRAELTEMERSEQTNEYAELVKRKRQEGGGQVGQDLSNVKGASGRERGDAAAARDLGVPRQKIRRSRKIANLSPEAKAAAKKVGLDDNQGALLEVARAPNPEQQIAVIEELALKKVGKPRSGARPKESVNDIVEKILGDRSASDVQLIIDGLQEGLAQRAAKVAPGESAPQAEIEQGANDAGATAPIESKPKQEFETDLDNIRAEDLNLDSDIGPDREEIDLECVNDLVLDLEVVEPEVVEELEELELSLS